MKALMTLTGLGFLAWACVQPSWAQVNRATETPARDAAVQHRTYYPVSETPWFSDPAVHREIDLNGEEYKNLHDGYGEAGDRYDQGRLQIKPTLSEQERQQQLEESHQDFHKSVSKLPDKKISYEIKRQRYNQLYWQHRGVGAFHDPDVHSRLNLSPD